MVMSRSKRYKPARGKVSCWLIHFQGNSVKNCFTLLLWRDVFGKEKFRVYPFSERLDVQENKQEVKRGCLTCKIKTNCIPIILTPLIYITDDMINDMLKPEFRNYMTNISSSKYGVDLSLKPKNDVPVATFRKLNIDWNAKAEHAMTTIL